MPTAVDTTMKVMYVKGPAADADQTTILQLSAAAPEMHSLMEVMSTLPDFTLG